MKIKFYVEIAEPKTNTMIDLFSARTILYKREWERKTKVHLCYLKKAEREHARTKNENIASRKKDSINWMLNPWCWYQQFIIFPHGAFYCSVGRFYINIAFMAISITHTVVCPLLSIFSYNGYCCSSKRSMK